MAEFFSKIELSDRKADEYPYHLQKCRNYLSLKTCLVEVGVFDKLYVPSHKYDLYSYWRTLHKEAGEDVGDCYKSFLQRGILNSDLIYRIGCFLEDMAKYESAQEVLKTARNFYSNEVIFSLSSSLTPSLELREMILFE